MPFIAQPGSVISGTLRFEDLMPRFCDVLETLDPQEYETGLIAQVREDMKAGGYFMTEEQLDDFERLCDALGAHAPEGHYFGTHEGDGSDFGFWTHPSWVQE